MGAHHLQLLSPTRSGEIDMDLNKMVRIVFCLPANKHITQAFAQMNRMTSTPINADGNQRLRQADCRQRKNQVPHAGVA